jgi:photosystem II stability/assembly factor-like uncharacterized protein
MTFKFAFYILLCLSLSLLGSCDQPRCNDGLMNQDETQIDCGGNCGPCFSCSDGIKNQEETNIDCGGPCPNRCADEWEPITVKGDNFSYLFAMQMIDNQTGFASTDQGFSDGKENFLLKTADGWKTWQKVASFTGRVEKIQFVSKDVGCVLTKRFNGQILPETKLLKTVDGGKTWAEIIIPLTGENRVHQFQSFQLFDKETLFVAGTSFKCNTTECYYGGTIIKTTNNGATWVKVLETPQIDMNTWGTIFSFNVFSAQKIVAFDQLNRWITNDGGVNWTKDANVVARVVSNNSIKYQDEQFIYAETSCNTSNDLGKTWKTQSICGNFKFINATNGYCILNAARAFPNRDKSPNAWPWEYTFIYQTNDGGANWQPIGQLNKEIGDKGASLSSITFINKDIWGVGNSGVWHYTLP